jgi:hypothetical protein
MHAYFQSVSAIAALYIFHSTSAALYAKPNLQALDKSHHLGFEWRCGRRGGGGVIAWETGALGVRKGGPAKGRGSGGVGEGERGERDVIMATNILNFWY